MQKILLASSLALLAACGSVQKQNDTSTIDSSMQYVPGEVLVKFKSGSVSVQNISQAGVSLQALRTLSGGEVLYTVRAQQSADQVLQTVETLSKRSDIEYAQPNWIYRTAAVPNDPEYAKQWHYSALKLPAAWDLTTGVGSPVVAVIDTGKTNHPELTSRWVGGYDFVSDRTTAADGNGRDSNATDPGDACLSDGATTNSWHGTHVAGTVGASTNNGVGVAGVNWNAKILPVRVLGRCGGSTADIIDAIRWSAGLRVSGVPTNTNPAKVLNMSLGGSLPTGQTCSTADPATQGAINDVVARGTVVVVAAGNSNQDTRRFTPASCANTVTVAATGPTGKRAAYSNFGPDVDVAAPGGDVNVSGTRNLADGVLSTLPNNAGTTYGYAFYQGTSMATPHVAGIVSLMLARNSSLTPAQVLTKLKSTSVTISRTNCAEGCGSGLVDAAAAVK
jgi:serine protease